MAAAAVGAPGILSGRYRVFRAWSLDADIGLMLGGNFQRVLGQIWGGR